MLKRIEPWAEWRPFSLHAQYSGSGTMHEDLARVVVAALADAEESGLATGRVLSWHKFFPESVILGCGPDSARAYPYTVVADGSSAVIKVEAPDHPLALAFRLDGSLDAGSRPYQVHGRVVIGSNDSGDFTFAPMEQTCNRGVLAPGKDIPAEVAAPQR